MRRNRISEFNKQRIVAVYERSEDYAETTGQLDILQATAYAIIRRYQQHGVVVRPRVGRRNNDVGAEMNDEIVSVTEELPEHTLVLINTELCRRLQHKPCDFVNARHIHNPRMQCQRRSLVHHPFNQV